MACCGSSLGREVVEGGTCSLWPALLFGSQVHRTFGRAGLRCCTPFDYQRFTDRVDAVLSRCWGIPDVGVCRADTYRRTLQWFLLGKLVVWIATHQGRGLALTVLGVYAIWTIRAVFLWTMS